jgi:hypothetical protein
MDIEITPFVSYVLRVAQEQYLPAIYMPTSLRQSPDGEVASLQVAKRQGVISSGACERIITLASSYNEVLPAWILMNVCPMQDFFPPASSRQFELFILQCRQASLKTIRRAIEQTVILGKPPSIEVVLGMQWLFSAESMLGNPDGAQPHAEFLTWLEDVHVDQSLLMQVLMTSTVSEHAAAPEGE